MHYCKGYMYFILKTNQVEECTRNRLMAERFYGIKIIYYHTSMAKHRCRE